MYLQECYALGNIFLPSRVKILMQLGVVKFNTRQRTSIPFIRKSICNKKKYLLFSLYLPRTKKMHYIILNLILLFDRDKIYGLRSLLLLVRLLDL